MITQPVTHVGPNHTRGSSRAWLAIGPRRLNGVNQVHVSQNGISTEFIL